MSMCQATVEDVNFGHLFNLFKYSEEREKPYMEIIK